jgi:5-methylcytosine-specific restriction endonuclease McrA
VSQFRGTYAGYLRSPYWRAVRRRALVAAGYRCQRCPAVRDLQVHHLTYERLGCEQPADVEVLCDSCHAAAHGRSPAASSNRTGGTFPEHIADILPRALAAMGLEVVCA